MAYKYSSMHISNQMEAKAVTAKIGDSMAIKIEFRITEWFGQNIDSAYNLATDTWYFSVAEAQQLMQSLSAAITQIETAEPTSPEPTLPAQDSSAVVGVSSRVLYSVPAVGDYDKHALDDSGLDPLS